MEPIPKLKQNMLFSKNLADIIEVLKMIAASEFRELSSRAPKENQVTEELSAALRMLGGEADDTIFSKRNPNLPQGVVMVCSDEGFLGEVNSMVVTTGIKIGGEGGAFVVLGDKGAKMLNDLNIEHTKFSSIADNIDYKTAIDLSDHLFNLFFEEKVGSVTIVYMKFISFVRRQVTSKVFLPYSVEDSLSKEKDQAKDLPLIKEKNMIIGPSRRVVLEGIVKLWLREEINNIFWSAKLSEWSSRVMHLEASSRELEDQNKALRFRYFKAVHALNDKNIREVFAALKA